MGMFEYGIGLSPASNEKEIAIVKLAYLNGKNNIKSAVLEIISTNKSAEESILEIRKLLENDTVH